MHVANAVPTELLEDFHEGELKLGSVMEVLHVQLRNTPVPCKTAVLRWIYHLHNKIPNKVVLGTEVWVTFFSLIFTHLFGKLPWIFTTLFT